MKHGIVSQVWSRVNRVARFAYGQGWFPSRKLSSRVISVGNIQAGGTGKTPLVMEIAKQALARGLTVGILSRGYGSEWEKTGGIVEPGSVFFDPSLVGDEVSLIHERVPGVWIGVGADRTSQVEKMSRKANCAFDLILLDDGHQHWKIRADLRVVAVTDSGFGETYFREGFDAITPDDLVVLTKGSDFPVELQGHVNRVKIEWEYDLGEKSRGPFRFICALGAPERAKSALEKAGFRLESMLSFPDHYAYTRTDVEQMIQDAKTAGVRILLTGKDAVKWKALGAKMETLSVVEPAVKTVQGQEIWERLLWG